MLKLACCVLHCQCAPLRGAWPYLFCSLPLGGCGLQWDIAPHPEPSLYQAGQPQLPQHHVLQPLKHLGILDWAPVCLCLSDVVCGSPGHR